MAELTIAKFGGSSVADASAMNHCANIIATDPKIKIVVLSASSGVTDLLVTLASGCTQEQQRACLERIQQIQTTIMDAIAPSSGVKKQVNKSLRYIETLANTAQHSPTAELTDELMSQGELMSTLLFTELLRSRNIAAEWFDIRQVMLTNSHFGKAEPDLKILQKRCQAYLKPQLIDRIVITQGFIGADSNGKTTTLGRGGSDYTAALLSEALNAQRIDIWTDVPGIYTTDPRIVTRAQQIKEISFAEASEMATFGAKILHPATLLPAVRHNIPVFVGSSKAPELGGTKVCKTCSYLPPFRALALRRGQNLLTLHSLNMLHAHGFLAEVFKILAKHRISVDLITTSEVSVALTLNDLRLPDGAEGTVTTELLHELSNLCRVEVEKNLALVALIGNQFAKTKGIGGKVFSTLDPFNIRMICYGASQHNLCILLPEEHADEAIRLLHHQLFETTPKPAVK